MAGNIVEDFHAICKLKIIDNQHSTSVEENYCIAEGGDCPLEHSQTPPKENVLMAMTKAAYRRQLKQKSMTEKLELLLKEINKLR